MTSMDLDSDSVQQDSFYSTSKQPSTSTSNEASTSTSSPSSLKIHRVRFPDWQPSSITSLAFPPNNSLDQNQNQNLNKRSILAIGRENGNIELCVWVGSNQNDAPSQKQNENSYTQNDKGWIIHHVLLGATSSKIESLAFSLVPTTTQTILGSSTKFILRLFSISGGSILTEHYLPSSLSAYNSSIPSITPPERFGQTYRTLNSNGGSIWSLASSPLGIYLAIGCDDGFVRLISIRDDKFDHVNMSEMSKKDSSGKMDERNVVDKFEKVKGRILSLAWGNPIKLRKAQKNQIVQNKEKKIRASGSDDESSDEESDSSSDDDDEDSGDATLNYRESLILAGSSRSCGLVFKVSTGRLLTKLVVPKFNKTSFGKRSNNNGNLGSSLVWSVLILPNGTFVLGDSNSRVTFFDSKTFTLIPGAEFRCHDKNSDVLSLCSSRDGKTVYSGGTDMKVSEISWMEINKKEKNKDVGKSEEGKWTHIISRRLHSHDVRSIAMDPPLNLFEHSRSKSNPPSFSFNSNGSKTVKMLPILVSGGTDFSLVLTPASPPNEINLTATNRNKKDHNKIPNSVSYFNSVSNSQSTLFSKSIQRKCSFVPTTGRNGSSSGGKIVSVAKRAGWLLVKRENKIGIWDLGSESSRNADSIYERMARREEEEEEDQDEEEGFGVQNHWRKIIEIEVKTHTNLDGCEISDDGNWLIISDLYESKLFRLIRLPRNSNSEEGSEEFDLKPSKVNAFGKVFSSTASTNTSTLAPSATCFKFDQDSRKLILSTRWDSKIFVIGLPRPDTKIDKDSFQILKVWDCHVSRFGNEPSKEGQEIGVGRAIASNGKVNGHTNGNGNGHLSSEDEDMDASSQVNGFPSSERTNFTKDSTSSSPNPLISLMVLSRDAKYLFTSDMSKRSYLFNLETLEFMKSLPSTQSPLSDACFLPSFGNNQDEEQICLLSPNGKINFHEVSSSRLSSSGSKAVEQRRNLLEFEIKKRLGLFRDSCCTISWISNSKTLNKNDILIVSGSGFILTCKFQGFSSSSGSNSDLNSSSSTTASKKRKENQDPSSSTTHAAVEKEGIKDREWNIRYTTKYQSLLHVSEISKQGTSDGMRELLVVERPFFDVARALPPGYDSGSKYGT